MATSVTNVWGQDRWSSTVVDALILQSALLRSPVPKIDSQGAKVYHLPRIAVNPSATWLAELATLPSDGGTEDVITFTPAKIGNSTVISNEAIEDASVDALNALGAAMARGLSHSVDAAAFSTAAATSTQPAGLLHGLTAQDTGGAAFTLDDLFDGIGAIQGYGGNPDIAFIAPSDLTALRKLKTSTGQYLWTVDNSVTGDLAALPVDTFGGVQFYMSPGMAAGSLLIADSRFIPVVYNRDIDVEFDPSAAFYQDAVAARVTGRFDWHVSDPDAVWYCTATA